MRMLKKLESLIKLIPVHLWKMGLHQKKYLRVMVTQLFLLKRVLYTAGEVVSLVD